MKTWQAFGMMVAGLAVGAMLALHGSADHPAKPGDVTEARVAADGGRRKQLAAEWAHV